MKKRDLLVPVGILALILGLFLLTGHARREEISDIFARQIYIDDDSEADVWISSSDTTYNWVHRSLDFSIGADAQVSETVSVRFTFSDNRHHFSVTTEKRKLNPDDETIFTASVPYKKFSHGTWQISAVILNSENQTIPLKNEDLTDHTFDVCTFRVR